VAETTRQSLCAPLASVLPYQVLSTLVHPGLALTIQILKGYLK
jgi:hypothetical protein